MLLTNFVSKDEICATFVWDIKTVFHMKGREIAVQ